MESFVRIVEYVVTVVGALVQIIDTVRKWIEDRNQKSNRRRPGQVAFLKGNY